MGGLSNNDGDRNAVSNKVSETNMKLQNQPLDRIWDRIQCGNIGYSNATTIQYRTGYFNGTMWQSNVAGKS